MEFIGQARLFRDAITRDAREFDAAMRRMAAPLRARLHAQRAIREADLDTLTKTWAMLPTWAALAPARVERTGKRTLRIAQPRLTPGDMQLRGEWDDPELGLTIVRAELTAERLRFSLHYPHVAHVGMHALARRFERAHDRSHEAVLADLRVLADVVPAAAAIPTPSGGEWRADLVRAPDALGAGTIEPFANIRTFIVPIGLREPPPLPRPKPAESMPPAAMSMPADGLALLPPAPRGAQGRAGLYGATHLTQPAPPKWSPAP